MWNVTINISPESEMTTKQVKAAGKAAANTNSTSQNLYFAVTTFDKDGHDIGFRVVDLYHFGTRKWLQQHTWWALHNGHTFEVNPATPEQTKAHIAEMAKQLAEKFNGPAEEPKAVAA